MIKIAVHGHPILKQETEFNKAEANSCIKDLKVAIQSLDGLGFAANQLLYSNRICVIRSSTGELVILANPEIIERSKDMGTTTEHCFSYPGMSFRIERNIQVAIKYLDEDFNSRLAEFYGQDAIVAQHEIDHLDGITPVDRSGNLFGQSNLKRILRKFKDHIAPYEEQNDQNT